MAHGDLRGRRGRVDRAGGPVLDLARTEVLHPSARSDYAQRPVLIQRPDDGAVRPVASVVQGPAGVRP